MFHCKDENMRNVLATYFSGAILPFIEYHQIDIGEDPEFGKFKAFATNNCKIFYDFTRFMLRNYIFNETSRTSMILKKERISKKEFITILEEAKDFIFQSKMVVKKFREFVNGHKKRALKKVAPEDLVEEKLDSGLQPQNFRQLLKRKPLEEEKQARLDQVLSKNKDRENKTPVSNNQNLMTTSILKGIKNIRVSEHPFPEDSYESFISDNEEHLGQIKKYEEEEKRMYGEGGKSIVLHNDTSNVEGESDLSSDDQVDKDYFKNRYGNRLLKIFDLYFERMMEDGEYICRPKTCKLPFLKSTLNDSYDLEEGNGEKKPRFSHSYRYASNKGSQDCSQEFADADGFLKE